MSIELKNITKRYGSHEVLKSINFSVKSGEIVGFLGPNGAGKSTTMKIIAGGLNYDSGSVRVNNLEVSDHLKEIKGMIGYLPEQNPLYTEMYVKEYLEFIADVHRLGRNKWEKISKLIDEVGLGKEAHKKIGELSKGYRQRVGLAQALIHDPAVIILDEPTTGLDPNQLSEIRALIRKIGEERTVLFSTHIMQEIEAVCDRVVIINEGEIVADYDDIKQLKNIDKNRFVIEVEFLNPLDEISINSSISFHMKDNRRFEIESGVDVREELFDFAVNSNNKILTMKVVEKKMEDIFKELTQG